MQDVAAEAGKPEAVKLAEALDASDVLVMDLASAGQVFTENRLELLDVIEEGGIGSIRGLARTVDRNVNAVMRDLTVLYENDVIEFDEDKNRKIPRMRHERVIVEPVV